MVHSFAVRFYSLFRGCLIIFLSLSAYILCLTGLVGVYSLLESRSHNDRPLA
uniref:Uncharacterized protein n=1 Tax=Arundo donax TaxID=35708 RepID=A0A0A9GDA8_ARUDO